MANEKNLTAHRISDADEAKKKGAEGGRKSGETRRKRRAFRDAASDIIRTVITDPELLSVVQKQGYEKKNMTYQEAMVAGMVYSAICGSPQAYRAIKDTVEPEGADTQEQALARLDQMLRSIDAEARADTADEKETGIDDEAE